MHMEYIRSAHVISAASEATHVITGISSYGHCGYACLLHLLTHSQDHTHCQTDILHRCMHADLYTSYSEINTH